MKRHEILRTLMQQRHISIADIVKATGIPYSTVKSIMENGVEKSGYHTVCAICRALSITTDELEQLAGPLACLPEDRQALQIEIADFTPEELRQLRKYAGYLRYLREQEP